MSDEVGPSAWRVEAVLGFGTASFLTRFRVVRPDPDSAEVMRVECDRPHPKLDAVDGAETAGVSMAFFGDLSLAEVVGRLVQHDVEFHDRRG